MHAPPFFTRLPGCHPASVDSATGALKVDKYFLSEGYAVWRAHIRGFDKIQQYAPRMKREILISFLPPVLLSVAIRLGLGANIVLQPDLSIGASQEWVSALAVLAGVPALIVFAGIRLWIARARLRNLGAILASALLSAVILSMSSGEPYWRLL